MYYSQLANKGFQRGRAGAIVYQANISVNLEANKPDYNLEENSPVERNTVVGLWVTEPGAKTSQSKTQAAGAIFNSAVLIVRVEESDVIKKLYFHQVKKANDQGHPFYLSLPGNINLSESKVEVYDNSGIAADTVLEFQVNYVK